MDWYLPGTNAGGPVRSVYSLIHLLKNEFDFYVITTNCDLGKNEPYRDVNSNVLLAEDGINYFYFSKERISESNISGLLNTITPQLVYLNSFWSYPFSISLVRLKNSGHLNYPLLLAPRGMLGRGAMGLKSFKKNAFLVLARLMGWYRAVYFHATNVQEKSDILKQFKQAKVFEAPNVNTSPVSTNTSLKQKNRLRLFYLSRIDRVKNLHFGLQVLSLVPAQYTIEYDIFGNLENKAYWDQCQEIIARLPHHIKVTYKGELPFHRISETISGYEALLMPTLNENFGHSIVESLLAGCPVIISDQTPWNDVAQHGAGFAISLGRPDKFAEAIIELARLDSEAFDNCSKMAITYISGKINPGKTAVEYKEMFHACIKN